MRKGLKLAVSVLLVLVIGLLAWSIVLPREPVYQGEPLSFWLDQGRQHNWLNSTSETAIASMGPRAVPALLNMAQMRDSSFRRLLYRLATTHDSLNLRIRPYDENLEMTAYGFKLLGPKAKCAVPKLVRLLHSSAPETRCVAAYCLGEIGPGANAGINALLENLRFQLRHRTNSDWNEKGIYTSLFALGQIGSAASAAIPQIVLFTNDPGWSIRWQAQASLIQITGAGLAPFVEGLNDTSNPTNWIGCCEVARFLGSAASNAIPVLLKVAEHSAGRIQENAIDAVGRIHVQPEFCLPRLTPFLHATNDWVRLHTLEAIGAFGTNSYGRVPQAEIMRCLEDSSSLVRQKAADLLQYVDPQIFAKTGF